MGDKLQKLIPYYIKATMLSSGIFQSLWGYASVPCKNPENLPVSAPTRISKSKNQNLCLVIPWEKDQHKNDKIQESSPRERV